MDIFNDNKLYPKDNFSLVDYYKEYFDNVFVGLIPFYLFNSPLIKEEDTSEIWILENASPILWRQIIDNTKIKNFKELNKALMTSIGAWGKKFDRQDLLKKLNNYTEVQNIIDPTEGTFDVFTKKSIYNVCKTNNLNKLIVKDEFYGNSKTLNLNSLNCNEFIEKIDFKDYHIYSVDKDILFTIDWDFYFFFIAFKSSIINKDTIENSFEGFWADKNDTNSWTWEKEEFESNLSSKKKKKSCLWGLIKK